MKFTLKSLIVVLSLTIILCGCGDDATPIKEAGELSIERLSKAFKGAEENDKYREFSILASSLGLGLHRDDERPVFSKEYISSLFGQPDDTITIEDGEDWIYQLDGKRSASILFKEKMYYSCSFTDLN